MATIEIKANIDVENVIDQRKKNEENSSTRDSNVDR